MKRGLIIHGMDLIFDGMRRIMNSGNVTVKWPDMRNGKQKDYRALKGDWDAIGEDFRRAIRTR